MRFAALASGSRGNALLVEAGGSVLMVDCGLPCRELESRLAALGCAPGDVTALLITHEHGDHVRGAVPFARRHRVPVWATPGTVRAVGAPDDVRVSTLCIDRPLSVGGITIEPFTVPHDAREPCQFVFSAGRRRLGVLTDAGHITAHIGERLAGCDALALECNHDTDALAQSRYPPAVKARVASSYGHLNNVQAAGFLEAGVNGGLQWVAALHLSERNNSPERVREALGPVLEQRGTALHVAAQNEPSGWVEID